MVVLPEDGERAAHNTRARTARRSTRAMTTTSASLSCSVSIATTRRGWRGASSSGRTPSAHETVPAAVHAPRIRAPPLRRTPRRAPGAVAEPPGPTSPMADTSSSNWRENPFARYCDDVMAIPEVVEGLRVLEQTHPEIDGNVVLFALWRATRGGDARPMSHAALRKATKISERWRWRVTDHLARVEASLRGPDLSGSPPAAHLADRRSRSQPRGRRRGQGGAVRAGARRGVVVRRRTRRRGRRRGGLPPGVRVGQGDRAGPDGRRRGESANVPAEYLGARFIATEWRRVRGVLDGCLAVGGVDAHADIIGIVDARGGTASVTRHRHRAA